jgi:hypothetical protein
MRTLFQLKPDIALVHSAVGYGVPPQRAGSGLVRPIQDAGAVQAQQEFVSARHHRVAQRRRHRQHARGMARIQHQQHPTRPQVRGQAFDIETHASAPTHMADANQARARRHRGEQVRLWRRIAGDQPRGHPMRVQKPPGENDGGKLLREHQDFVAVAPRDAARDRVQGRAGTGEKRNVRRRVRNAEQFGHPHAGIAMRRFQPRPPILPGGAARRIVRYHPSDRPQQRPFRPAAQMRAQAIKAFEQIARQRGLGRHHVVRWVWHHPLVPSTSASGGQLNRPCIVQMLRAAWEVSVTE